MTNDWSLMLDFMYLSLFILIAVYIKSKFKIFDKFLLPTSIIAGFIGLILGPEIFNLTRFDAESLKNMVYHLMAIGFIALALKERNTETSRASFNTGLSIVATYIVQGIIGFGITLILFYTLFQDLFPAFGLILPLGFGQGPGVAYSIGHQWETSGFLNGGDIGLSISTLGFLWASIGGVIALNFLVRKKRMEHERLESDIVQTKIKESSEPGEIPLSSGIDKISIQLCLIGIVYLVSLLTIKGLMIALEPLGSYGATIASLLEGFNFLFGTVYAILLRIIFNQLKKKKVMVRNYPNNYLLQRISGAAFDYMIVASIAALSISVIGDNIIPLLIVTSIGGLVTFIFIFFLCKKVFKNHTLEYILALFGMLTGTLSTGLALLKEVDPEFNSQVAENLVFGSAIGLGFGLPLFALLSIPVMGYTNNNPALYFYTLIALAVYLVFLFVVFKLKNRKTLTA